MRFFRNCRVASARENRKCSHPLTKTVILGWEKPSNKSRLIKVFTFEQIGVRYLVFLDIQDSRFMLCRHRTSLPSSYASLFRFVAVEPIRPRGPEVNRCVNELDWPWRLGKSSLRTKATLKVERKVLGCISKIDCKSKARSQTGKVDFLQDLNQRLCFKARPGGRYVCMSWKHVRDARVAFAHFSFKEHFRVQASYKCLYASLQNGVRCGIRNHGKRPIVVKRFLLWQSCL